MVQEILLSFWNYMYLMEIWSVVFGDGMQQQNRSTQFFLCVYSCFQRPEPFTVTLGSLACVCVHTGGVRTTRSIRTKLTLENKFLAERGGQTHAESNNWFHSKQVALLTNISPCPKV